MSEGRVVVYVGEEYSHVLGALRDASAWSVHRAGTVSDALARLDGADCIVSESALPDGDGLELRRRVERSHPGVPFVLVTGQSDPETARAAVDANVTQYVPVETLDGPEELRTVVEEATRARDGDRYRRLVEHTTDVVAILDPDGTVEYADPTVEAVLGYEPPVLEGRDALELVHPDDRGRVRETLTEAVATPERAVAAECRVEDAQGDWTWVETRARRFADDPAIEGVVVSLRDVDERKRREAELTRYEAIVEAVDDHVFALDEAGRYTFVDGAHESLTGWSSDELLGSHPSSIVPDECVEKTERIIAELRDGERSQATYEMEAVTPDGSRVPCEAHITLLTDDEGRFRGTAGVVRDVSDRKENERLYSTLVEEANDGIVITKDGRIQFVNDQMVGMLEGDREGIVDEPYIEFVAPADRQFLRRNHMESEPGANARFEIRLQSLDGETFPAEVSTTRVRYQGETGELAIIRDITDRKGRERELELYETMLSAVPDTVYAIDDEGEFLAINETGEQISGYAAADLVGEHVSTVMDEADVETGQDIIRDLLGSEREQGAYEMDLYTADGETIPVENHVALLTDDEGRFRGSVGVLRDITDRLRRERRLAVLNRALRHDLRNSMHVILANADLVERRVSDPDLAEKLRTIQRRAEQINSLSEKAREIEQILGDPTGTRKPIDLAALLEDQLAMFYEQYPDVTIDASLPAHAWVEATELVDVAVENLIENSIQHTEDPSVELRVTVDEETVTVTVADDGPGIPEKERRVVRQGTETPLDHASGLGLWLVAWITRDSGGDVVFEETDGDGSVVHLKFSRAAVEADATCE